MLQRIDGPTPLTARSVEGVGVSSPADAPQASATQQPKPSVDHVLAAVASANQTIRTLSEALQFEVDPDTDKIVIKLVDTEDRRVLRQVPSQEMLAIARALERMQTMLVRGKA